jgi:hypothetical protein
VLWADRCCPSTFVQLNVKFYEFSKSWLNNMLHRISIRRADVKRRLVIGCWLNSIDQAARRSSILDLKPHLNSHHIAHFSLDKMASKLAPMAFRSSSRALRVLARQQPRRSFAVSSASRSDTLFVVCSFASPTTTLQLLITISPAPRHTREQPRRPLHFQCPKREAH